jgi:glycosyltransferase involved in cell wall biosynthesis
LIKLGIQSERIIVNHNPVEINSEIESPKEKKPYFLYAGRISNEKGLTELIDSFIRANLKNFDLIIAGDGPSLNNLRKKYNLQNITFLGQKNNKEIINLIKNSRAVVTATKIFEGQPTILTEASINNTLSIFPITGGVPEFFPVDYKFKYEQNNYESLIKMMIDAAESKNTEA